MTSMTRLLALPAGVLLAMGAVAGCSSSATSTPAAAAATTPVAVTPAASIDEWASGVCIAAKDVKTAVNSLIGSVATGGTDIRASIVGQLDPVKASAASLATNVSAIPADAANSEDVAAVKASASGTREKVDALSASVTDLQAANGIDMVPALGSVGMAAKDAWGSIGATVDTIRASVKDGDSPMAQAFKNAPECEGLRIRG